MSEARMSKVILKWLGIFVVVTAGVFTGVTLSVKYTGAGDSRGIELPADLRNSTNLTVGEAMPLVAAQDVDGEPVDVNSILPGHKTVLSFVSQTCGPCGKYLKFLEGSELLASGEYQVILLSVKPEDELADYVLPAFRITEESQKELAIDVVPTMVGIGEDATVQFVACGFTDAITDDYVAEHL